MCPEEGVRVSFLSVLVTLGTIVLIFEGLGDRLEFDNFLDMPWETPG